MRSLACLAAGASPGAAPEWIEFRPSPIHGTGGFARSAIHKSARVLEYLGDRISRQESLRRCEAGNPYIFRLSDDEDLDGMVSWNPARFINHSCAPNCDAELHEGRVWIVANRDIKAGEEITFNYSFDLVDYRDYPCHCGSPGCVGYIVAEAFFDHIRRQRE